MAHYLFNVVKGDAAKGPAVREQADELLRVRMWGVDPDEPRIATRLPPGDLVLIYLGAPERVFIGCAELALGSMIGHRLRLNRTRVIPLAECRWLTSRNGTRPCR